MADPPRRRSVRRDPNIFPPIKPEHAQAIGYIAANWALVEESLAHTIGWLLRAEAEPMNAITGDMSGLARFDTARALLVAAREQEWVDDWDDLAPTFNDLRARRNIAIHSVWHVIEPSHWAYRITSRAKVTLLFAELSTEKLQALAEEIMDFLVELDSFNHRVTFKAAKILGQFPTKRPLSPDQGRRALAQAQAREAKQARRAADRQRTPKPEA